MTAQNQNVRVFAGDFLEIKVLIRTPTGGPVSPAGITARYQAESIITKSSAGGGIVISEEEGTMLLTITLLPEDTAAQAHWRPYPHEIEIRDAGGRPFTVLQGTLTIAPALID